MPIILEPASCIERVPLVEHLGKTFSQAIKHMGSWSPDRSAEPGRGGRKNQPPRLGIAPKSKVESIFSYVVFSYVVMYLRVQLFVVRYQYSDISGIDCGQTPKRAIREDAHDGESAIR